MHGLFSFQSHTGFKSDAEIQAIVRALHNYVEFYPPKMWLKCLSHVIKFYLIFLLKTFFNSRSYWTLFWYQKFLFVLIQSSFIQFMYLISILSLNGLMDTQNHLSAIMACILRYKTRENSINQQLLLYTLLAYEC